MRGIGIGVIVATLIMTVSSVIHNNNLSDETIIKEARKLGMIMPEETQDNDSLWGNSADVEASEEAEISDSTEVSDVVDSTESGTEVNEEDESEEVVYHTITITDLDAARHVGEKLKAVGVISDAEEFRLYLRDQGYAKRIRSGTFQIPEGATYEEICAIIVR